MALGRDEQAHVALVDQRVGDLGGSRPGGLGLVELVGIPQQRLQRQAPAFRDPPHEQGEILVKGMRESGQ
eukprot:11736309-Heterocapsa_arctica.AAC.1